MRGHCANELNSYQYIFNDFLLRLNVTREIAIMKHVSIRVYGRVQGVCFRAYAQGRAERLGLAGFVKNMPDRSVYMEAEGPEENVEAFADWARQGPPAAKVTDIQVNYSDHLRKFEGFEIRYW